MPKTKNTTLQTAKIQKINNLFQTKNWDALIIAKQAGFNNHREMGAYLREKGYLWNRQTNSYLPAQKGKVKTEYRKTNNTSSPLHAVPQKTNQANEKIDINKYLPLLELLSKHQKELELLLKTKTQKNQLILHNRPGIFDTKAVRLDNSLVSLIEQFGRENKISVQEVIQTAVLELIRKYRDRGKLEKALEE